MHTLDISRIKAVTIDLDDTLWPVWPTITRAEEVVAEWLRERAPATAAAYPDSRSLRRIRERIELERPELRADLSAMRRESIRAALIESGDDPALAEPAFDIFFAERQNVVLFEDALETLEFLASRYPLVAISNGNADLQRIGLGRFFKAALSAQGFGVGKPDARIFHAGAQQAGHAAQAVLHVGDDQRLDVEGALNAGMQTAWINMDARPWELEAKPHAEVTSLAQLCAILR
ncbi:HAD family hydrolase [Diaphorobacter aerolatus]|uniref:HAD-IA family hydrolase n=1 Tax=Diaphorobacter aerolatus TaxID=1288495 RepID=A0A7H0GJR0_9BURK|nr:HAD-IA family hydrolase [Diaphorobacter aerolatus]QNP48526.1 HAD-IA family hydrolase [Diaphorobacter aerolatus]